MITRLASGRYYLEHESHTSLSRLSIAILPHQPQDRELTRKKRSKNVLKTGLRKSVTTSQVCAADNKLRTHKGRDVNVWWGQTLSRVTIPVRSIILSRWRLGAAPNVYLVSGSRGEFEDAGSFCLNVELQCSDWVMIQLCYPILLWGTEKQPSKHQKFTQCRLNVAQSSVTLVQY